MKTKAHIYYIGGYVVLGILIFFILQMLSKANDQNHQKDSVISEKNSMIELHTNSIGRLVAEKNAAVLDLNNLKKSYPELLKAVQDKLDIQTKNLMAVVDVRFEANGSGSVQVPKDTIQKQDGAKEVVGVVDASDGYLDFKGTIHTDVVDYLDYKYKYSDSLLIAFDKKWKPFKGTTYKISGTLSNPNAFITHTTGAMVQTIKPKMFVLSVGPSYDVIRKTWGVTVQAGIPIISF